MLEKMGITSYKDVIFHLPRGYVSYGLTPKETLYRMNDKQKVVIHGKTVGRTESLRFSKTSNVRFYFDSDVGIQFRIMAWNQPYLATSIHEGDEYTIQASYDAKRHCLTLISMKKGSIPEEETIQPVYSLPLDYPQRHFISLVKKAFEANKEPIEDIIPNPLMTRYRLLKKEDALYRCHFPKSQDDVLQGTRTLKYEEALLFCLKNQIIRQGNKKLCRSYSRQFSHSELTAFVNSMPFELTASQKKACKEIVTDMERPSLMNRLLQGDVGTGKTLVAGIAIYTNYLRGRQGAIMAPTDALARQHYAFFMGLFKNTNLSVALLVGTTSRVERLRILEELREGTLDLVVGTHALFSKDVIYQSLGLAIIDEQHKFGVNQRAYLASKGDDSDLLLMTATPIPRTLAITLYGSLDVSTLTDFPFKKREVKTMLFDSKSKRIDSAVSFFLNKGKRIFVVAPQIEEGENDLASVKLVYENYKKRYSGKVTMLHGKMTVDEKEAALLAFQTGLCPILVSTSVIEVGIDIKEACLMIVYEANRFALSSLHQLRGRIGRDGEEAYFIMVSDEKDEESIEKLSVLLSTDDGFKIAEADLRLRGPGTIGGLKQSGLPDFDYLNAIEDFKILEAARNDASEIVRNETNPEYKNLLKKAKADANIVITA